jgi:tetratricopeptide (TPR) repeat protein
LTHKGCKYTLRVKLKLVRFDGINVTISSINPLQRCGQPRLARIAAAVLSAVAFTYMCEQAEAQRYTANANPDSPEGQFIELINLQSDDAQKLALMEQFAQRFPKHQAISWAYEYLQASAFQAGQWDKVLSFGEKLEQLHPDDLETANLNLKAAESRGDKTTAKLWSDYIQRIAQRFLESPPPKDPELLEEWKKRIAIASQYAAQDEYAIYKKAIDSGDPRQKIKLLDDILKRNPDSPYLPQALVIYLNSYRALGDHRNALLYAERILKTDQNNEDALLIMTESYVHSGSAPDKVVAYSNRLIDLMHTKSKPAAVRQEDWDKKKAFYTGSAYWMIGNVQINQNHFAQADSALRAALPLLRNSEQSAASILFYLGWANYKTENFAEAVRFYKQCMALRSQFQEQAAKNLNVIRTEQGIQ